MTINTERGAGVAHICIGIAAIVTGVGLLLQPPRFEGRKPKATATLSPALGGMVAEGTW
jgi:hypothetical protein